MPRCPLCYSVQTQLCFQDKKRCFHLCVDCQLVFADAQSYLPAHIEQNQLSNTPFASTNKQKKIIQFTLAFIKELSAHTDVALSGLNYGQVLDQTKLEQVLHSGHYLAQFNPICSMSIQPLQHHYDFVSCYQVLEHFKQPAREWQQFSNLLKPDGWLGISTRLLTNIEAFGKWHHKNNHNHVCFYQSATFKYLAKHYGFKLKFATDELILMQKTSKSAITRDLNTS